MRLKTGEPQKPSKGVRQGMCERGFSDFMVKAVY